MQSAKHTSGLRSRTALSLRIEKWGICVCLAVATVAMTHGAYAQQDTSASPAATPANATTQQLDRVIAVVNNQVILASDLDLEIKLFRLLPINDRRESSPPKALERLTTRALIEQQILLEDPHGLEIAPKDLEDSLAELRTNLPACKHRDCNSPSGWSAYLITLDLTPDQVAEYWSHRMAMLRFIEERFRSGIRIPQEDIQKYYNETLLPQYAKPEEAPQLEKVATRIQEILLQQQVNALFDDWLKSLQDQGQVEVLDPTLAAAAKPVPTTIPTTPHIPTPAPAAKPAPNAPQGNGGAF